MKKIGYFFGIVLCLATAGFYFYDAQMQVLTSDDVIDGVVRFVNHYYRDFVPYEVKNNHVIIDKTEYVRNIATMYDILCVQNHFYSGEKSGQGVKVSTLNTIHANADYYLEIYKENPSALRQASSFLALLLHTISAVEYAADITQITDTLYQEVDDLEPQFELGEVLMALSIIDPRRETLNAQINKIIKMIEHKEPKIDDIFQYNWLSKFIVTYKNDDSRALFEVLCQKVSRVLPLLTYEEETNYLAVTFECLASLFAYDDQSIDVGVFIEKLTGALIKRYNREYGLFEFKNGDMRFDITGHVINGFILLYEIPVH